MTASVYPRQTAEHPVTPLPLHSAWGASQECSREPMGAWFLVTSSHFPLCLLYVDMPTVLSPPLLELAVSIHCTSVY